METFAVGRDGTCYLMDPEKSGSQDFEKKTYGFKKKNRDDMPSGKRSHSDCWNIPNFDRVHTSIRGIFHKEPLEHQG